ncbi:peptidoglycan-binding protein [Streptomyces sp. ISL-66]|uniref:peptidoglycan-binding protein n=1 Tax=Streptomyces sp. ISL-66 TaxID=2819186 RepID=UPI001BE5E8FD|nr:peptidoglycan-binding protein [Streptomyces sp. ISL-66]MBT2472512.1 peptidoglycan-binding protein [Streptomyces sp. ISL-66]
MPMPAFEEYQPAGDCPCRGCAHRRRALARARAIPLRDGGHPAARGARRALVLATAAGVVFGGGGAAVAVTTPGPGGTVSLDDPGQPQGGRSPLHGGKKGTPAKPTGLPGAPSAVKRIDRATIINRAKVWLDAKVPYSMSEYWVDGYRQDCSGYISMAWNLGTNEWTGSLDKFATRITKEELLPGDMLLFHNPADPTKGSHVVLFGGWVDESRTHYVAYEQTKPTTRRQATPYGYWDNPTKYLPYRFNGVTGAAAPQTPVVAPQTPVADPPAPGATPAVPAAFPGASKFGPGANNAYVAQLGRMLSDRGGYRFYPQGVGTKWTDSDRLATQAFQKAQGWTGTDADGLPGAHTWRLLARHQGKDIPPTPDGAPTPPTPGGAPIPPTPGGAPIPPTPGGVPSPPTPGGAPGPAGKPAYPGKAAFRPGASHPSITALGRQLVRKGFGKYYTSGPGPRWGEVDRRNVEAFQRAQGWRGAEADGYPGPETWRRLFA